MKLTFDPAEIKGGEYRFDVGTAGSVTLVAQCVLPVLLKAEKPSVVTITGGTHVPFAPIWEFFAETYLPELRRMGAEVEAELVRPGFYPAAGGEVRLRIKPFDETKACAYELKDLGAYKGGRAVGVVSGLPVGIADAEAGIVAAQFKDRGLRREVREVESFGPGNYCYARFDFERATVVISSVGTHDKSRKAVANEIVQASREFLESGAACEMHLADQLLVPAAVLLGERRWYCDADYFMGWKVKVQQETQHFETNQGVIDEFLGE